MKFCKDCKYYQPGIFSSGGTLLPGFAFTDPPRCKALPSPKIIDLVSGDEHGGYNEYCRTMRDSICGKCGPDAKLFEPANLEGRLAMLDGESK